MASYIFPTVCSVGIISQANPATTLAATKIFSSIDENASGLFIKAHSTNGADVIIGSAAVTTAGANEGLHLVAGDDVGVAITGPAADEFYQISTSGADAILAMQIG